MKRSDFLERVEAARRSLHHKYLCAIVSTAVFLAFAIYLTFASESFQRHYLYPFPYRDAVETYADRYRVDPYLAIAVIKTESKFQDSVHSHRGAIGLMQLMPETAEWIAGQLEDPAYSVEAIHEPERNIHDIDAIPYQETREYVKKVLLTERKYRTLYPDLDDTKN